MAKKPTTLERSIASAQLGAYQPPINIPAGRRVVHTKIRSTTPPDVREQIVRIYQDADPVGFLMDVVNGKMIEKHEIREEDGVQTLHTTYEQPNLNQRIKVATYLAEKYMPRLAVVSHRHMHTLNGDGMDKPGAGQRNMAQILNQAARHIDNPDEEL